MLIPIIARHIEAATGTPLRTPRQRSAGGGCINSALVLEDDARRYFVKTNRASLVAMFAAEAAGLDEIRNTGTVRFGWGRENTIGSTPQINTPSDDWIEFWRERRLGKQLELAAHSGYCGRLQRQGERLLGKFAGLFAGYRPLPSLLHGDLWSGNYAADAEGNPVIYDPAPYYGDREADLAMTELFGGFGRAFYNAYQQAWPLDDGYRTRKTLYNLYHILNHLNLFGGGYLGQAESMIDSLLAEIG